MVDGFLSEIANNLKFSVFVSDEKTSRCLVLEDVLQSFNLIDILVGIFGRLRSLNS